MAWFDEGGRNKLSWLYHSSTGLSQTVLCRRLLVPNTHISTSPLEGTAGKPQTLPKRILLDPRKSEFAAFPSSVGKWSILILHELVSLAYYNFSKFIAMVHLHYLDLFESPVTENGSNYDRFHMTWVLDDTNSPIGAPDGFKIQHGDLVVIEDLFTGAGEFEGVRMVIDRPTEDGTAVTVLAGVGIECMEWPSELLGEESAALLRSSYEKFLNQIISKQMSGYSLSDLVDDVEEFWDQPVEVRPPKSKADIWKIPLSQCKLKQTTMGTDQSLNK